MDTRLKEVRQTDLTEGRINQEFLDWMQTKGTTWLLVALVALCGYLGFVRWKSHRVSHRAEAWKALAEAKIPSSLEEVAEKYAEVDAVADLARIQAANELITALQTGQSVGQSVGAAESETPLPLTEADRETYLTRADGYYAKVLEGDDQSPGRTLLMVQALNGRAAVAESRGQLDEAKSWYEKAAQRAEQRYPALAEQAREHAASAQKQNRMVAFPAQIDLAKLAPANPETREPAIIDDWARDLLVPKESASE